MGATGTGLCELKAQLASIQLITTWSEQMTAQLAAAGGIPTAVCTRSWEWAVLFLCWVALPHQTPTLMFL